eukprot:2970881-Pleurochrysis_carterae.AAC.1
MGVRQCLSRSRGFVRMMANCGESSVIESLIGGVWFSRGLRCVGVLTMSGPESLGTANTPLPLALGG